MMVVMVVALFDFFMQCEGAGDSASLDDQHVKCPTWASLGECELNSGYMLENCAASCRAYEEEMAAIAPNDLYSISETDFHGQEFRYRDHKNKWLLLVNAAADTEDPLTDANYRLLTTLSKLRSDEFEIVLFPSFQFEKASKDPYYVAFYAQQSGFEGIVLRHGDVNGINRFDTFKYLLGKKLRGSIIPIRSNFHAKIFLDKNGEIMVEPSDLLSSLLTMPRGSTLSVEGARLELISETPATEIDGSTYVPSSGVDPRDLGVISVAKKLCDAHLCSWFELSQEDCNNLKLQILLDAY